MTDPKTHWVAADPSQKDAEPATRRANAALAARLPFDDQTDFADARRGFIASHVDGVIRTAKGTPVWMLPAYRFLDGEDAPPTVNPSLWRMARLNLNHGLFAVVPGVYQVRGLDIANMTIIEGASGIIVVDPLTSTDTARAALELYYAHRPRRPVVALVYSHSHVDHYGGVKGVISDEEVRAGRVQVIAPAGFLEAVAGENVLVGNPMLRRAQFQFGDLLRPGPRGQVDAGLGKAVARGAVSLIAPTRDIRQPVETHRIDGVEIVFQLAPGTEAPAEMHLFMPAGGVLNMAENATRHLHNFCPLRGAVVRDPRLWSHYLAEALELFGAQAEVLIGQHHWPTWGRARIREFLERQRDLYKYLHDQTVRLMNHGWKPAEIAEVLDLPPELAREWPLRGYYGTISHNAKAVYQRYLSWYDGNPANLNPLPSVAAAQKMVAYMGGAEAVLARAREDFARGEYRWVAQVTNQVVFADPDNRAARALCADAFEQLGYQAESATWRNAYLTGARELRHGVTQLAPRPMLSPALLTAVTTATLFDFVAVRLDPARVAGRSFVLNWVLTDTDERVVQTLKHSTLTQRMDRIAPDAAATVTTTREVLVDVVLRRKTVAEARAAGSLHVKGEVAPLEALLEMLDDFALQFEVVAPRKA
ncbi:MAG TPA: alkyl sulfatase dimerization domain-containing protein [Burkholderiales bacterium]|nr:alkyl sulfatase dimerization domain-containing protein [Burkholderiales bacterium]